MATAEDRRGSAGESNGPQASPSTNYGASSAVHDDNSGRPSGLYDWRSDATRIDYSEYQIEGTYQDPYVLAQLQKEANPAEPVYTTGSYGEINQVAAGPGEVAYMGQAWDKNAGVHYTWTVDKDYRAEMLEQTASTRRSGLWDTEDFNNRSNRFVAGTNPWGSGNDAKAVQTAWQTDVLNANSVAAQREYNSLRFSNYQSGTELSDIDAWKLTQYETRLLDQNRRQDAGEDVQVGIGTGEIYDPLTDAQTATALFKGTGAGETGTASLQLGRDRTGRVDTGRGKREFTRAQL